MKYIFSLLFIILFFPFILHAYPELSVLPQNGEDFDFFDRQNNNEKVIALVINSRLLPDIYESIDIYYNDLLNEGYRVIIHGRSPDFSSSELHELLTVNYNDYRIEGAFFIGNIAYQLYEDNTSGCVPYIVEYYFMDLTGNWIDEDSDGWFDSHTDSVKGPEIYTGRLCADNLGLPEADLINDYFKRNHNFRTGKSIIPQKGIQLYAPDVEISQKLVPIYGTDNVTIFDSLSGDEFKIQLENQSAELCVIGSHSNPYEHWFAEPNPRVDTYQIMEIEKDFNFYIMHCCSLGDFEKSMNMAGAYLLVNTKGLALFAVTKDAAAWFFNCFFASDFLNFDQSIGKSLYNFQRLHGMDDVEISDENELYIFGDPTLRLGRYYKDSQDNQPEEWLIFNNDFRFTEENMQELGDYYNINLGNLSGIGGQWFDSNDRFLGDYKDDVQATHTENDFLFFNFYGNTVEVYGPEHETYGPMEVWIDYQYKTTINMRNSNGYETQILLYTEEWNKDGRHNIILVNTSSDSWGVVDFFRVRVGGN